MFDSKERISFFVYYSKAIAIVLVLMAHCCIWNLDSQIGKSISLFCKNLGTLGVAIFFVVSGFLFNRSRSLNYSLGRFFVAKIKRICIPWFCSTLVFFAYIFFRNDVDLKNILLNAVGYKSFYWYLTITLYLYFIYFLVFKLPYKNFFVVFLGLISLYYPICSFLNISPVIDFQINPIRWFYFFSAGVIFSEFSSRIHFNKYNSLFLIGGGVFNSLFFIVFFVALWYKGIALNYKSFLYLPIASFSVIFFFCIAYLLTEKKHLGMLEKIGKYSFGIYLYQMFPWTGLLVFLANKLNFPFLIVLNPFICLFVCVIEFDVILKILKSIKKEKYVPYILGIPEK